METSGVYFYSLHFPFQMYCIWIHSLFMCRLYMHLLFIPFERIPAGWGGCLASKTWNIVTQSVHHICFQKQHWWNGADPLQKPHIHTYSTWLLGKSAHLFSSPVCSATTTTPQCAAPTIRTTRMSVSCAGMPASSSLKYLLCQKVPVQLVCTFTLWHVQVYTNRRTHTQALTPPLLFRIEKKLKKVILTEHFLHASL